MKNPSLITLFFALLYVCCVQGQNVRCDKAFFRLEPFYTDEDTIMQLHIMLNLQTDSLSDSIKFITDVKMGQPDMNGRLTLCPRNVSAMTLSPIQENLPASVRNIADAFFCDKQIITIKNQHHQSRLSVSYDVIGTGAFPNIVNHKNANLPYIYTFYSDEEHVYPMNMSISEIEVCAPDSFIVLKDRYMNDNGGTDVDLTFISRNYVNTDTLSIGKIKFNLYTMRSVPPLNIRPVLKRALGKLSEFTSKHGTYDVVRALFRIGNSAYGHGLHHFIYIDNTMAPENLVHELMHLLFPVNVRESTKGNFFVSESIIEWLAQYLCNGGYVKDTTTEWKNKCRKSIYNLKFDNPETAFLIYCSGPEILEELSKEVGRNELAKALISFMEINADKEVCYVDFIAYIKGKLPQSAVNKMDKKVRFRKYSGIKCLRGKDL